MCDKDTNVPNKNDYISREAATRIFNKWKDDLDKQIDDSVGYPHLRSDYKVCKTQLLDCIYAIKEMPAADVRPAVRGKWIHKPGCDGEWICNQCSHELEFIDGRTFGMPNYCPNCGAEMRERDGGRTEADPSTASRSPSPCQGRSGRETGDAGRQTRRRAVEDAGPYGGAEEGRGGLGSTHPGTRGCPTGCG